MSQQSITNTNVHAHGSLHRRSSDTPVTFALPGLSKITSFIRSVKMVLQARGLAQARAAAVSSAATAACVVHPCQSPRTATAASADSLASCSDVQRPRVCSSSNAFSSSSSSRQHSLRCCSSAAPSAAVTQAAVDAEAAPAQAQQWTVLNFYHLVDITDPEEVRQLNGGIAVSVAGSVEWVGRQCGI